MKKLYGIGEKLVSQSTFNNENAKFGVLNRTAQRKSTIDQFMNYVESQIKR